MIDPATRRFAAVRFTIALVVVAAATGCATTPGGSGASSPVPSAPAGSTANATPGVSIAPPSASAPASAPSPPAGEASLEPPPRVTLVAGAVSHPGEAGSWAWAGGTSDSPWLPARALERTDIPAGTVSVELDDGVEVESWTAVAAAADDTQGVNVDALGDGSGTPSFQVAGGDWVVAVDVRFAGGRGSAIYYWHLVVT